MPSSIKTTQQGGTLSKARGKHLVLWGFLFLTSLFFIFFKTKIRFFPILHIHLFIQQIIMEDLICVQGLLCTLTLVLFAYGLVGY